MEDPDVGVVEIAAWDNKTDYSLRDLLFDMPL